MRFRELLEYKRDITATNFRDKLWDKMTRDRSMGYSVTKDSATDEDIDIAIDMLLQQVEEADPSPNKQYVQWMVRSYISDTIDTKEDIVSTTADMLERYHTLKVHRKLPASLADIGKVKGKGQLIDFDYAILTNYNEFVKDKPEALSKGDSTEILNNDEFRILVPHDQTAACYYGQGTRWCTAARSNNMFADYDQDGPLFIVIPKNPQHRSEKYQLHFCSNQYMDEADYGVRLDDIGLASEKYGKLFAKYDACAKNNLDFHSFDTVKEIVAEIVGHIKEHKDKIIKGRPAVKKLVNDVFEWNIDTLANEAVITLVNLSEDDADVPYAISEIPVVVADILDDNPEKILWNFIYEHIEAEVNDDFSVTTTFNSPAYYI